MIFVLLSQNQTTMKYIFIVMVLLTTLNAKVYGQGASCGAAVSITVNGACSASATISDATVADATAPSCGTAIRDGWYSFVATQTNATITAVSTSRQLLVQVFSGTCASLTQIGCANANTTAGGQTETVILAGLTIGNVYFIRIVNETANNMALSSVCVTATAGPTNDQCAGAIAVTCGNSYSGNTSTATATNDPSGTCGTSVGTPGVWYQFNGDGSIVTASLCSSGYDTKIHIYSGSCGSLTCVDGNDDGCGSQSTVTFTSMAATTYYIFVGGYGGATGAYTLDMSCCTPAVPGCATAPSIAHLAVNVSTCAPSLSWTAPANAGCDGANSYDVYFGTIASPPFVTNTTATNYNHPSNLAPSTTYYWKIVPKNSMGDAIGCTTWRFTTNALGCTDNDFCSGATAVTCAGSYAGTTVGATTTNDPTGTCGTSVGAAGRWYVFAGNGNVVTASLCTSGYDTKINVYSGNCASLSCVDGNDDGCGSQSTVTFGTSVGVNYYIFVNGYSGATGAYTLDITCCAPTAPACATLTAPANGATGVSPCIATLDWNSVAATCGVNATYDIYFGTTAVPPFLINVTTDSYTIPYALYDNTTYYWKIVPRVGGQVAAGCPTRSFTTGTKPNGNYCLIDDAINYPAGGTNCAQITADAGSQRGCIWNTGTISFLSSFDYTVNMYFGNDDAGADGCTFVFQNGPQGTTVCGTDGVQLGAGGIPNAVVVEFDTYDNGSNDPNEDHTAIYTNGDLSSSPFAGPAQADPLDVDLEDGLVHAMRVTWNAATHQMCIFVDGSQRLCATNDFVTNVFGGNPNVYWGFTGSTGLYTNQQYFCPVSIPLAVDMQSSNAKCTDNGVLIKWTTASETNNKVFFIERTTNGIDFTLVGAVEGSGNSNSMQLYEFIDIEPVQGNSYYRIIQEDFDGSMMAFPMMTVTCNMDTKLEIVSATFVSENQLVLNIITPYSGIHNISLNDGMGRLILLKPEMIEAGSQTLVVSVPELSEGVYVVGITQGNNSAKIKVPFMKR